MPVITRSQAHALTNSTSKISWKSSVLLSLGTEPSNIYTTTLHLMNLITESLDALSTTIALTSLDTEHSDHIASSMNINNALLPTDNSVDTYHLSRSPSFESALLFQNTMDQNDFGISNLSSVGNLKPSLHPLSVSHNSSISNFSITANDCEDSPNKPNASTRSQTTQDMLDMNHLFASITAHITSATQKISSGYDLFYWNKNVD